MSSQSTLDYDDDPEILCDVEATDEDGSGNMGTTIVNVTLNDVNNKPPVISTPVSISVYMLCVRQNLCVKNMT